MSEERYRLVTRTQRDGSKPESNVSDTSFTRSEVNDQMTAEALAHRLEGWAVTSVPGCVKFEKPDTVRVIRAIKV